MKCVTYVYFLILMLIFRNILRHYNKSSDKQLRLREFTMKKDSYLQCFFD